MNVFFIYKNNTFNFNIKKDVSITYLKNLVSKMIQKDKSSFDLFYNNKILAENCYTLFQVAKNETNVPIIVSLKNNNNIKKVNSTDKKLKLPVLTQINQINHFKTEGDVIDNNINTNLNDSEIFSNSFSKDLNQFIKGTGGQKKKIKYTTINKVFEDIYNKKEESIINLMNDLKNKILEYDNALYYNYKSKKDKDNKQLLLYEKNVINFKDKQIQFLKKLISYFDITEASFFSVGKLNLEEFYQELLNYYNYKNTNTFIQSYSMKKENKIINNNKNIKIINFSVEKLPKISNTKTIEDNLLKSSKLAEDSFYNNSIEIMEEKANKYLMDKKQKKQRNNQIGLSKTVENNINSKLNLIEKNPPIQNISKKKNEVTLITENNNNHKEFNYKKINTDKPDKNERNIEHRKLNQFPSSKSIVIPNRDLKTDFDENKINVLYDISENKHENTETYSDEESETDNVKYAKALKKEMIEQNLKDRKKTMKSMKTLNERELKSGYKFKFKDKKTNQKLKKLGDNYSDFLI